MKLVDFMKMALKPKLKQYFPTFASAFEQQRKLATSFLILFDLILALILILILLSQEGGVIVTKRVRTARPITVLATAYGSQRHIFGGSLAGESERPLPPSLVFERGEHVAGIQDVFGGSLVAVWLKNNQINVSFSNNYGESWQESPSPLVSEKVESVAGAQDKDGNIHLVYESRGRIFYRKISGVVTEGQVEPENWSVSEATELDSSGLARRPSLILENPTDLPVAVWSSESEKAAARSTKIHFMRAKADPTVLKNWCNAEGSLCGQPAYILVSGSADSLGIAASHAVFHPVLVQMPESGDFYLFWSDTSKKGNEVLKLIIGKKQGEGWRWEETTSQGELDAETFANFSLAAVADVEQNRVVIAYAQKGGNTKVVAYKDEGETEDLSPGQKFGSQFSLATTGGEYYLFYRKDNGKISGRRYDGSWSEELVESSEEGGYPSVTADAVEEKLFVIYTTAEGKVNFLSYSLAVPTPTPTLEPTPTIEITPTASPSPTLEATPSATPSPTLTPTETPTPSPEATPTATPTVVLSPALEPTPTATESATPE